MEGIDLLSRYMPSMEMQQGVTITATPTNPIEGTDVSGDDGDTKKTELSKEQEALRALVKECEGASIEDVAERARSEEASQYTDRYKGLVATWWLRQECEALEKTAVPRNKLYEAYQNYCHSESLKPLTTAAFGRLIRVEYSNVQTRRLGVRGQSRYHYCGIRLKGDKSDVREGVMGGGHSKRRTRKAAQAANASFANHGTMGNLIHNMGNASVMGLLSFPSVGPSQPTVRQPLSAIFSKYQRPGRLLKFLSEQEQQAQTALKNSQFQLPMIEGYLPSEEIDHEHVREFLNRYHSHCTSLIEFVATLRIKQFVDSTATFYQSLSEETKSIMLKPSLIPWIHKTDLEMYKQIVRIINPLAFQVIPPDAFEVLRTMSIQLLPTLHANLNDVAPGLLSVKLVPAGEFASLLCRLLKVNETAHASAKFLNNDEAREMLRLDWLRYVDINAIVHRELACGEDETIKILDSVLELLGPKFRKNETVGSPTPVHEMSGITQTTLGQGEDLHYSVPMDASQLALHTNPDHDLPNLDLWKAFLPSIPQRFPKVEPRLILLCMGTVNAAILREITINGGQGFGALWVVVCWIEEWMRYLCEQGGFLVSGVDDLYDDPLDLSYEDDDGRDPNGPHEEGEDEDDDEGDFDQFVEVDLEEIEQKLENEGGLEVDGFWDNEADDDSQADEDFDE